MYVYEVPLIHMYDVVAWVSLHKVMMVSLVDAIGDSPVVGIK